MVDEFDPPTCWKVDVYRYNDRLDMSVDSYVCRERALFGDNGSLVIQPLDGGFVFYNDSDWERADSRMVNQS